MKGISKNKMTITTLEKRLMLDASLGALVSSIVLAEDTVNATPQVIDSDVTVTGTTTDFDGEALTISTNGGTTDQLTIVNEGTGAGQIGFDGTNVTYGGTLIGTLSSNGTNGANLTIDLNANASKAAIERLIENVTYQNTSDTPSLSRTVNIQLGAYFSENVGITIVAQNDDPVTTTNNGKTLNEGATTTITTADLNVTDPDDTDANVVFSVTSATSNGQLELTTNPSVAITSFTLDDIVNNRVVYVHDDSETSSDSFDFTVTDGDTTLATDTFSITVNSVNDPLSLDTNTGTTVFQNLSTIIGAEGTQFGTELLRYNANGQYTTWDNIVDNQSHQYALVFTTPGANPSATPGQVLFESGGSGVGVGLFLNNNMELDFYSGAASNTPRLSSDALLAGTQYALVVEIDQATDEIRMHYEQASNFNWFGFGRAAEKTLSGYTATDHSGSNQTGIGQVGGGSYGGYNGSTSGTTSFQGTIDSDVVITEFPTIFNTNTILVANDLDTSSDNIVYTITNDVANGTLYRAGVALGLNDTFTQSDLNIGLISYTNAGGLTDSFDFSVTDGTTVVAGQTFNITIDTSNVAPEILTTTTILDEDFEGGTSGWNNNTTTTHATLSEFWGRFNRNVNVADNQELYQTFATSGSQDYIVVEFDMYELDTWDNEYFYLFVNDTNVLGNSHRLRWNVFESPTDGVSGDVSYSVQETTEALGYIAYNNYYDQTYHYTLVIENSDPSLKLGFGSSLNSTNLNDEAFGIDNLKITEVRKGGANNQEFYIAEDAANNSVVGTVQATDDNAGQTIAYSITGGTGSAFFSIDNSTGEVRVTDNSSFDFESTTSYTLDIEVTDGALSSTQTITINMLDVMENTQPTFTGTGPFTIAEDASVDDDVGTVTTSDAEGDNVTYSIVSGNVNSAFKIDATTGLIEVNAAVLDFDTDSSYTIRIRATDDNALSRFRDQNVVINITDVDEAPSLDIETVIETQNTGVLYNASNGNFYKVETDNLSFDNAVLNAQGELLNGVGGHLVTITTQAEYEFVRDYASPSHVWIALSDEGEEGKWIWTTGPEAGMQITQGNTDAVGTFNRWLGAEPNSGSTRNHALMNSNTWWYDNWPGTNGYDSVIEWEGSDIINNDSYSVNHTNPDASDVNVGDSVGFVQGVDPEGDSLVFTIENGNADGIFEIVAGTGEVRILDTTNLDATVNDTYTLTIRATEASGTKFDEIDITVKFNDDFSISANNALNVNEDSSAILTTAALNISDLDGVAADTIFRVTTLPSNGQLEHATNPGFQINSFTLDDLQNNRISFVHDGSETTTDSFTFQVTDGGRVLTGQTFNINVVNINDAPTIATNTGTTVVEGANVTLTDAMLDSLDIDDAATGLTFTASSLNGGHIEVNGVTQSTFTQDDIDNGLVVFVHDGSEPAVASFAFSLADGGENGASPATGTFSINVTPVNDTPTITTNTGATVVEGANVTVTTAMLNTTDPDDSGTGLVYTLSNINNGQVELSTNPGVPVISFTQDDLNNNRVVFAHDGGESDAQFDVSVADGGEDGATADTVTFNLTRTPVNDSPLVGINTGTSINQNSIVIIKNSVLRAADPDDSGAGLTYTVTGTTNGQVEFLSNPNVAIASFTQDDIDNSRVIFRHSGPPGVADFDFTLTDGGEDGSVAANGTFNLTVDNVNDAPTITTSTGPTVLEGSTTTITTAMLDSFDPDDFGTDLTWTASNLSNGILQVNGVTQNTFTQDDLDNGLVTFIHDGTETLTAGFDIQVADGGENGAAPDTDTFTMTITPVNEGPTLIVNDGSPNVIDFNDYTVNTFDPSQDGATGSTSATVSPDGSTLTIGTNSWKKIDVPYTLTANTVLSLEFRADSVGEIFGIGFDTDNSIANGVNGYQLGGTQIWSGMDQSFRSYAPGDGWVRYDIPIGADYTGAMTELVFVLDDDASPTGTAIFRNVNFYESDQTIDVNEGGTFNITNAYINSTDPDDSGTGLTYTASNLSNGVVQVSGVTQNTFTQDDIDNNRVTFVHDGSETANAGFDISLADGGEDGASADTGSFTLVVNPINDAAAIGVNTGATMNEGANLTITTSMLNEADNDDDGANLTYTASAYSNGHIEVGGVTQNTFTQDDIDQGRVVFVHDGTETITASFNISLADGLENGATADTGTFNITVTPQNDGSTITTNTGGTLNEGASLIIGSTMLNSADPDDGVTARTYTASNITNGHIEVGGVTQNTFTQDDINNNRVVFIHDDSQTTAASFDISLADGLEHGAVPDTDTFNMTVTPINDGATISSNNGATMNEGANLTLTTAMLNSTDPDDTTAQRTYTASALSNGHIEVGGVTQNTFTQDDVDNGRVVFIHDGSETITASFNLSLADGLENGAIADTDTFNITVTPVNDAPVVATNNGDTIAEGASKVIANTVLSATDVDNTDANLLYTITALPAGVVTNTNTASILTVGSTFTQGDIDNGYISYTHDGGESAAETLSVTLSDGTATLTAFNFDWTVTRVNDAPTDVGITTSIVSEDSGLLTVIGNLHATDVDLPGDSFTYSIMADPDNKFMILGNQLMVNAELDFETAAFHNVMIRADDGNGGTFDQMFTINVLDVNESNFIAPDTGTNIVSGSVTALIEEDDRIQDLSVPLLQDSIFGDDLSRLSAFYGDGFGQILRENTTVEVHDMINNQDPVIQNDPVQKVLETEEGNEKAETAPEAENFTTMRQMLESMAQFDDAEKSGNGEGDDEESQDEFYNLYEQFDDVLTYHEQRKGKIREALLSSRT